MPYPRGGKQIPRSARNDKLGHYMCSGQYDLGLLKEGRGGITFCWRGLRLSERRPFEAQGKQAAALQSGQGIRRQRF